MKKPIIIYDFTPNDQHIDRVLRHKEHYMDAFLRTFAVEVQDENGNWSRVKASSNVVDGSCERVHDIKQDHIDSGAAGKQMDNNLIKQLFK